MKKAIQFTAVIGCLLVLCGCPYESSVPPGYPGKEETKHLWSGGKFICRQSGYDIDSVLIKPLGDYSYKVKVWAPLGSENYTGYYTKISGTELFYVEKKTSDGKTTYPIYILEYLLVMGGDSAVTYELNPITFKNEKYSTTEELREIIKKRLANGTAKSNRASWSEGVSWLK